MHDRGEPEGYSDILQSYNHKHDVFCLFLDLFANGKALGVGETVKHPPLTRFKDILDTGKLR